MIELTHLIKTGGPLTKRIALDGTGKPVSDGSACVMSRGHAQRAQVKDLKAFADLISALAPHEAIALGSLRGDLPDQAEIVTQDKLRQLNGTAAPHVIARTADHIAYRPEHQALALIDFDCKGMPADVAERIKEAGGVWTALVSVCPELATCGRVVRASTSAGLRRSDTGEDLSGSGGLHIFLHVQDGADIERFLRTLHERCWLAGFGWHMVGGGGQRLDRSLVDRMVFGPERLVFEGTPILEPPLIQDDASRKPLVHDGVPLDTLTACPPLRIVETSRLMQVKAASAHALAPEQAKERERFIAEHAARLAERTEVSIQEARKTIERQTDGVLLSDVVLPWDDDQFADCTVADVLADPDRFDGATLADPLEGVGYGRTKAMMMRRPDGTPWIHSFAHGRTVYELKHDVKSVAAAVEAAADKDAADAFVQMALNADLDADQIETLRDRTAQRAGVGKRAINFKLKAAQARQANAHRREEQNRQVAERRDPRPQISAPPPDAPWLPQMEVLNDVLGSSPAAEPPMRDIDGYVTQVLVRRLPNMHALTSETANDPQTTDKRQEASEQPLLIRLDKIQLGELIERHVDHVDERGRSVHLASAFVDHFLHRSDHALPTVAAISTLPLVLGDGTLLSRRGLHRERGIVFRVPSHILDALPSAQSCTPQSLARAMAFLVDEWLCDVATDYTGKAIIIAAALTIIERSMLPERPAFFVTAGRRGGGKTTVLQMLCTAVMGSRPSAAAWSPNEEERRKALLSYLMTGLPAIIWDNIPRGTQIGCPHIEASLTSAFFSDRKLGVSETVVVSAATVQMFTGNNVSPKGDLASRSLQVRLEVDRHDPENRPFRHPDPLGWTEANRPQILCALYTILMGNPMLRPDAAVVPETRFKSWWRLVGSAVEQAARMHLDSMNERVQALVMDAPTTPPVAIKFRNLFLCQEQDDEENTSLAEALSALAGKWPQARMFGAADAAQWLNYKGDYQTAEDKERAMILRDFLYPQVPSSQDISSKSLTRMLKRHVGEPVLSGERTLVLRQGQDSHTKAVQFWVEAS